MEEVLGMFYRGESDCLHNMNDNCTNLQTYGECPNDIGRLVERLEVGSASDE